ncbi:hypothetical protein NPX13_g1250 [Xylaria arbuscula]|uniref:Uncharacterized protein n=1 Tax=Xylaria arbuscula TaxID=114810 RepID=A0A9W8TRG8_9PEZI|nr:hypothetical protein NPX13_g1250 [Xylaria arbuscula]
MSISNDRKDAAGQGHGLAGSPPIPTYTPTMISSDIEDMTRTNMEEHRKHVVSYDSDSQTYQREMIESTG